MAEQRIVLYARRKKKVTIFVKDQNGDAIDLTGYTVKMYLHDNREKTNADNIVDGEEVDYDDRATGEVSFLFTAAHMAVTAEATVECTWQLNLDDAADLDDLTDPEPALIRRNRMTA